MFRSTGSKRQPYGIKGYFTVKSEDVFLFICDNFHGGGGGGGIEREEMANFGRWVLREKERGNLYCKKKASSKKE